MRMDDVKLQLLGIENANHRYEILKEIYKQVRLSVSFIFNTFQQLRNHEKYFKELNQSLSGRNGTSHSSNNTVDQYPPMFGRSGGGGGGFGARID